MDIKNLLRKYMKGDIKSEELLSLQECINKTEDKNLDPTIKSLWEETQFTKKMDSMIKEEVRDQLSTKLQREKRKYQLNWKIISIAVLLPLLALSIAYSVFSSQYVEVQEFNVKVAKGQKSQVYLPDGTVVWLNSGSSICYNSDFNRNNRSVKLKGQAFFDVVQNDNDEFIVDVEGVEVVVHGTAFDVKAYDDEEMITVSLNRGKVSLVNSVTKQLITDLIPNQKVMVNRENLFFEVNPCDAELTSLWTKNRLQIEDADVQELFKKIECWYGVNIYIENSNNDNRYSLTIKTESLREMLGLINRLTPISYKIDGEEVRIKYIK